MSLDDLPQSNLFLIFLALFVLLGIYPAWQRTAAIIRKFLAANSKPESTNSDSYSPESTELFAEQPPTLQLDTLESIVFHYLVQNDGKSLSRKQINADLHLQPLLLKTTLESLLHRGLLKITTGTLPIIRFQLSEKGRSYAQQTGAALPIR